MADQPSNATASAAEDTGSRGTGPDLVRLPTREDSEPYRPLSLLAVTGLALAVGYSLLVNLGGLFLYASLYFRSLVVLVVVTVALTLLVARLVGIRDSRRLFRLSGLALVGLLGLIGMISLVAFSGSNPWVLPFWTILLPLGTGVLCWMARVRIRASEGTLAGAELATWGLGLSLFFGLNYTAYLASNYFAIRQQAVDNTDRWIQLIRQNKLQEAFLLTQPVSARPAEGPDLLEQIEVNSNTPRPPGEPGPFSRFSHSPFVHQLVLGGPNTKVELARVSPTFDRGTYQVEIEYQVKTDYSRFNLLVYATGTESVGSGGTGRQWQILGPSVQTTNMVSTPLGDEMNGAINEAGQVAGNFYQALQREEPERGYLLTLPPEARAAQDKAGERLRAAEKKGSTAVLALVASDPEVQRYRKGMTHYQEGGLVRADKKTFWIDETFRAEVTKELKALFRPYPSSTARLSLPLTSYPFWEREGERFRLRFPLSITLNKQGARPDTLVESEVVVESPAAEGQVPTGPWQVKELVAIRSHSLPTPSSGPGGR